MCGDFIYISSNIVPIIELTLHLNDVFCIVLYNIDDWEIFKIGISVI